MARWVDAELLAKAYLDVAKEEHLTGLLFISPEDVANTILRVSEKLDEVAPVVHAHWVEFENPNYSPFDNSPEKIVLCSHCSNGHGTKDDYCCVCGAKMDEVVEE